MKTIHQLAVAAVMLGAAAPAVSAGPGSLKDELAPIPYTWAGFYLGVNAGYGTGTTREDVNGANDVGVILAALGDVQQAAFSSLNASGFVGGAQGGYNWQTNRTVYGGEIDVAWANVSASTGFEPAQPVLFPLLTSVEQDIEWLATFRLRAGYLAAPNMLLYITGGLALGGASLKLAVRDNAVAGGPCEAGAICSRGGASDMSAGYAIGGGLEFAVSPGISLKGEYLYTDLGSVTVTTADAGLLALAGTPYLFKNEAEFATSVFRVGLNFKLNRPEYIRPYK